MRGWTLSNVVEGSLPLPFLLLCRFCSASLLAAALLHVTDHLCPPLSPTKPRNHTTVTPSACSSNHEPKSLASDAEKSHSLSRRLPLATSSLTAAIRAPPTSLPHLGGPRESVVWPRLHLCRQRPPVRVAVKLSSAAEFLTVAPSLQ
jgi:hypothetical protein